jgi:CPA2 family monovalent cation:H+ antiporter-2
MSVLVGVGLTQIGEFSFVLVRIARSSGLVGEDVYNGTLAASVITILLNAVLMRLAPAWVRERQIETEFTDVAVAEQMHDHIVICGFGRIGSLVGTALESFSLPYVVVETDPDIVRALRARSVPCIYGNAAHSTILERTHIDRARLVVLTVPDKSSGLGAVRNIRRLNAAVPIIARAHRAADREDLLKAGATQVIQPEIEASAVLVSSALQHLPVSGSSAQAYTQALRSGLENAPLPPPSGDFPVSREIRVGNFEDDGQSLAEAHVRERFGVTIIAVNSPDGETFVNPPAATTIRSGDRLRVFGLPKQIAEFEIYVGARAKT